MYVNGTLLSMQFFETSVFTRQILGLLDDDSHKGLQDALILQPEAGDVL